MTPPTNLALLGSTGSIGVQTLDVVARLREAGWSLRVVALAAGRNGRLLANQIESVHPELVSLADERAAEDVRRRFPGLRVLAGEDGLVALASLDEVDVVVNAVVGAAGLPATLAALARGRTLALANKESLVTGGDLVRDALATGGGRILPIDSEHSALLQCLDAGRRADVDRLLLTASGGPFLDLRRADRLAATAQDALRHPTWSMGKRITIDSATLVNKAFEVIEAHYLFDVPYERIDAVIHPASILHSLVQYRDGSLIAQAAAHDMRIPIQYALTYPERVPTGLPQIDLARVGRLEFRPIDREAFPAFGTVLAAAREGGTATAAVNAADEVLVGRFLAGDIPFGGLERGLEATLDAWTSERADGAAPVTLHSVRSTDRWARVFAGALKL